MNTVEYDLKDILTRIDTKLDRLSEDVKKLEIGQVEIKGEIATVKTKLGQVEEDVSKLKAAQDKQIWILILTVVGAIFKFTLAPNWHF